MSERPNYSPRKAEMLKNFAGRASSLQEDEPSPTSSPSLRKKNTFFGSLRYTKKKNRSIEILKSQELISEDQDHGRVMVSQFKSKIKIQSNSFIRT